MASAPEKEEKVPKPTPAPAAHVQAVPDIASDPEEDDLSDLDGT